MPTSLSLNATEWRGRNQRITGTNEPKKAHEATESREEKRSYIFTSLLLNAARRRRTHQQNRCKQHN